MFVKFCYRCTVKPVSKRPEIGFQDQLSLNAGQNFRPSLSEIFALSILNGRFTQVLLYTYNKTLQTCAFDQILLEHSAILSDSGS